VEKEGKKGKELKRKESELVCGRHWQRNEALNGLCQICHKNTAAASTYNVTLRLIHPYPNLESHFPIDSSITQLPNDRLNNAFGPR
jgi:hypothetical protein